jgi:hypothetical protein
LHSGVTYNENTIVRCHVNDNPVAFNQIVTVTTDDDFYENIFLEESRESGSLKQSIIFGVRLRG